MILMLLMFYGIYLAIVLIVSVILKSVRPKYTGAGVLLGAAAASMVSFSVLLGAVLLFESNESYWHYGPHWRSNVLIGGTAGLFLAALISGPIVGGCVGRRFSNRGR